jgi:hypothetical protein
MNDRKRCGFYKHYMQNGRRIIEPVGIADVQNMLHAIYGQLSAPDLATLNDKPQPDGWHDE